MTPALTAMCATHPEAASVAICRRCGSFLCATCQVVPEPPLCAACAPLWTDRLGVLAAPFGTWNALRNGLRLVGPVLPQVLLLTFLFAVPGGLLSAAVAPSGEPTLKDISRDIRVSNLYDAFIGMIGNVACLALFIGVAEGRRLTVVQALHEALARWGRVFGAQLRAVLWILLFGLLVFPGIWKAVVLAFTLPAAVRVLEGDALELSAKLVKGHWWPVFGMVLAVYGALFLPAMVISTVVTGVLDDLPSLKFPSAIFEDWVMRASNELVTACLLAAFYGLLRNQAEVLPPLSWRSDPHD